MAASFFFYDLETSGVSPSNSRIMQFAGQRTDENLNPTGDPYNILIKITEDVLPDPDAILITGITPQKTLQDGITEAEFCKIFSNEIVQPDTCFIGFNNIRFDDEFLRFLLYRNFHDPYSWHWDKGCSRWDLLDVSRMTRALKPEGIKWPVSSEGKPTNRLEMLTSVNNLQHEAAHDALSDVNATIAVAKLIKDKQPKLFEYLKNVRFKKAIKDLVSTGQPFVYSSGKYSGDYEKTAIVQPLGPHPDKQGMLVYDLREDPIKYVGLNPEELAKIWRYTKDKNALRLPVKDLQFNRCPAVAPIGVVSDQAFKRLGTNLQKITLHRKQLAESEGFYNQLCQATGILNKARAEQSPLFSDQAIADTQLYENFISDHDKKVSAQLVKVEPAELSNFKSKLNDERLKYILPLYKARNYSKFLTDEERQQWEEFRSVKLKASLTQFGKRLSELAETTKDKNKIYLLEELQLYAESILPES